MGAPGENQTSRPFAPLPFGHLLHDGPTHEGIAWGSYLQPWVCQMAIMVLQALIGVLLTQEARAYACVNAVISSIEHDLNESINAKIAAAAGGADRGHRCHCEAERIREIVSGAVHPQTVAV